jgi:hypothetical protein
MTGPMNDDFANRELSIAELDVVAAGGRRSWIKHAVHQLEHKQTRQELAAAALGALQDAIEGMSLF